MGRKNKTKDNTISVRFTEAQKEDIQNHAEDSGISVSEYIREKSLDLDLSSFADISELRGSFLKTLKLINELARDHPESISGSDYRALLQSLDRIDQKYYELIQEIKEENQLSLRKAVEENRNRKEGGGDGNYKADQDEGSTQRE